MIPELEGICNRRVMRPIGALSTLHNKFKHKPTEGVSRELTQKLKILNSGVSHHDRHRGVFAVL